MISIIIASRNGTIPNLNLEGNYEVLSVTGGNHVSEARNKGASSAKGDILLFDDDDISLSGNLYGLEDTGFDWWIPTYINGTMDAYSTVNIVAMNITGGPVIAVRKSVFDSIGGYKSIPWEDANLIMRLSRISRHGTMNVVAVVKRPFTQLGTLRQLRT